jgi:hypothetical protein
MASKIKTGLRSGGIRIKEGFGDPTHSGHKGEIYIKLDASGTTDRLWINTDGGVTWGYFTSSA